jgi:hypothetical protein
MDLELGRWNNLNTHKNTEKVNDGAFSDLITKWVCKGRITTDLASVAKTA